MSEHLNRFKAFSFEYLGRKSEALVHVHLCIMNEIKNSGEKMRRYKVLSESF